MSYKVLNLLSGGNVGGIENLCKSISDAKQFENCFCMLFDEGVIYEEINRNHDAVSLKQYGVKKVNKERISQLVKLAKDYDIIVVHHSAIAIQVYYAILKMKYPKKKFVLVAHSCFSPEFYYDYSSAWKNKIRAKLQAHVLKISDKLIFVSKAGEQSYRKYFPIKPEKCCVVYNGVSEELLEKASHASCEKPKGVFAITYVGRLEDIKGVHLLIDAVAILKEKYPIQLTIVGYGAEMEHLQQQAKERGMADITSFEGMQRDIGKYLEKTDIFVYPSVCEEVFGISIVEAMAFGVPCVSNRVGGIPEIIEDQINGQLTTEKSGEAVAAAIQQLMDVYIEKKENIFAKACKETANRFSIKHTVDGLERCYDELMR